MFIQCVQWNVLGEHFWTFSYLTKQNWLYNEFTGWIPICNFHCSDLITVMHCFVFLKVIWNISEKNIKYFEDLGYGLWFGFFLMVGPGSLFYKCGSVTLINSHRNYPGGRDNWGGPRLWGRESCETRETRRQDRGERRKGQEKEKGRGKFSTKKKELTVGRLKKMGGTGN